MESYKISDFLEKEFNNYLNKEIIIMLPQIRVRGEITNIIEVNGKREIYINGVVHGVNFLGNPMNGKLNHPLRYRIKIDEMIENYKTDRIRVAVL